MVRHRKGHKTVFLDMQSFDKRKPLPRHAESLEDLKKTAADKKVYCSIQLNGGLLSSKDITYYPSTRTWDVVNHIDDSIQEDLTDEQLEKETHIVEAINKKALLLRYID